MGGKNKGGSKHQKPETSDVATKNTEEDMKSKVRVFIADYIL